MNWYRNANTTTKLMLAFSVMAALLGFVGHEGLRAAGGLNDMVDTLYQRDMLGMAALKEAQATVLDIGREARQAVIETDQEAVQQIGQTVDQDFSKLEEELGRGEKTLVTEEGKQLMAKVRQRLPEFGASIKQIMHQAEANDDKAAHATLVHGRGLEDQFFQDLAALVEMKDKLGRKAYDDSDTVYYSARRLLIAILLGAVMLAVGAGYFISRLIARPLARTVEVLQSVAACDLTRSLDIDTKDEVGEMARALNQAVGAMREAMTGVRGGADGVATASEQLAASAEELASGAQEQASSQEETSASLEELSAAVKQNAESAHQANQLAAGARDAAEKGGEVVRSTVTAMSEINAASKRIADIITTIDEIAFQTNLLALNAAVEAARAGELGRGFAVVASEVRNLAQRSATAAREIKTLIQDSVRKVETGSELVGRSGHTLGEIITAVKRVTDIVSEISAASREQATGIEQVTKAMAQMDQVTQTNSAQTEELSSTSQTLASHATQMQAMVAQFVVDARNRASSGPPAAPPPRSSLKTAARPKTSPRRATQSLANLSHHTAGANSPQPAEAGFEEF